MAELARRKVAVETYVRGVSDNILIVEIFDEKSS